MHEATDSTSSAALEWTSAAGVRFSVQAIAPQTFRLRATRENEFAPSTLERYRILTTNPEQNLAVNMVANDSAIVLRTSAGTLSVARATGQFTLAGADGKVLLACDEPPWLGAGGGFQCALALDPDEPIYGLGDVSRDGLDRRTLLAKMWVVNVAAYIPLPLAMSPRGWGVLLNTTWRQHIDVGARRENHLTFSVPHGELDLLLFVGAGLPALLDHYTDITGKPALLPLWGYGLTYVCNQQANAREMLEEAERFRRERIPCDLIGLEPGWMSKHYDLSTEKCWHPERFFLPPWATKGPATFLGALQRLGFRLSLWLCCEYDLTFEEERQAGSVAAPVAAPVFHPDDFEQDEHFGHEGRRFDALTKPDEPWFAHLKKFVDQGVAAFKLDGAYQVNEHPDRLYGNGMTDEQMHNLYPTLWSKQMALGFTEQTKQRPMIYSSGGYLGIQRYAATWAGDTGGGAKPLVSMLNLGLSGMSNVTCDMDVFSPAGIHFGFLQPWSQLNNWAYWRQPWYLEPPLKAMFQFYAQLHYRLLPYIYSAAHVANRTGLPVMRAMVLAFPGDDRCRNLLSQYMLGDWLLTAAFQESVYLPAGQWIDYWTQAVMEGGRDVPATFPADRGGPLFVRGGAIIPTWPPMQYVGEKPVETITLDIYPAGHSEYELVEDDGISLAYRDGAVTRTQIVCDADRAGVRVTIHPRTGHYQGMPERRDYVVRLHLGAGGAKLVANDPWHVADEPGVITAQVGPNAAQPMILVWKGD